MHIADPRALLALFARSGVQRGAPTGVLMIAMAIAAPAAFADEPGGVTKIPPPQGGQQVYTQVCQACHMPDGRGAAGAATIPALANNPRLAAASYPVMMVAKGRGVMPWFDDILTPTQIADVVVYVRTHFGNSYAAPVTAADVTRIAGPKTSP